jgi:periplasmic copper chaperone A
VTRSARPGVAAPTRRGAGLAVLVALLALLAAACSSGSPASAGPAIVVSDAWVQVSGGPDLPAAGYFTVANNGSADDTLVSASSPVATTVELHETMPDMSGMTGMQSVTQVACPAGGSVSFAPGGFHLMITGFSAAPVAGGQVELDLNFRHAGKVVVKAVVRQV